MKRSLWKDAVREVRHSLGRYLSIMAIVCLGVGFFSGIQAAAPDMIETADTYYKDAQLMDVHFQSTMGLTDDDVQAVLQLKNVDTAEPGYTVDTIETSGDDMNVVRILNLPDRLNQPRLIEGRMPRNDHECVVENGDMVPPAFAIGNTITLSLEQDDILDTLVTDTFTIVGVVESPLYVTYQKGASTVGSGSVSAYIMIPKSAFQLEYYTDIYATLQSTRQFVFNSLEYKSAVKQFTASLTAWETERTDARYLSIKQEAQDTLNEEKAEAMDKLNDAKQKLDDAQKKLNHAQKKLNQNRKQAEDGFQQAKDQLSMINQQLSSFTPEQIDQLKTGLDQALESAEQLDATIVSLRDSIALLEAQLEQMDPADSEYAQMYGQLQYLNNQLSDLETQQQTLQTTCETLQQQWDGYQQLLSGKQQCEAALAQQSATEAKLNAAQKTINNNRRTYQKGLKEYQENYDEAMQELADAQQEIDDIEYPTWYTTTRDDNIGYSEYADNAERIAAIAKIFPAFFLLIAALVCLTSMTRMVEENRTLIGSYKAMGYNSSAIAGKYLLYSGSATLIGAAIGLAVGFRLFPTIIINAYNLMYRYPAAIVPFRIEQAVLAVVLSLLTTSAVTWLSVQKELKEVPAALLRPKTPKNGKRILLERWTWLWKKFSFSHKVTARNLFRYKKRMCMTVIGIAGCTALMVCGFGIRDSVNAIGSRQFGEIFRYDLIAVLADDGKDADVYRNESVQYPIEEQLMVYSTYVDVNNSDPNRLEATLLVPEFPEQLSSFIHLHHEKQTDALSLPSDGAIISQKMAKLLKLEVGDTIAMTWEDQTYQIPIADIAEFYANHWIFLSPEAFTAFTGASFQPNQSYIIANDASADGIRSLSTTLMGNDAVLALSNITDVRSEFTDMISSLNTIVIVLIISAGALAFIVLFNLVNINVTERIRELATIKVLGFRDREVTNYLYRENVILTGFGIFLGLFIGILLHRVVMTTLEINNLVFGKEINILSFVYAVILTVVFSLIVNVFTHHSLKRIDMIESLKSVE